MASYLTLNLPKYFDCCSRKILKPSGSPVFLLWAPSNGALWKWFCFIFGQLSPTNFVHTRNAPKTPRWKYQENFWMEGRLMIFEKHDNRIWKRRSATLFQLIWDQSLTHA